jgi:hypothetical protein
LIPLQPSVGNYDQAHMSSRYDPDLDLVNVVKILPNLNLWLSVMVVVDPSIPMSRTQEPFAIKQPNLVKILRMDYWRIESPASRHVEMTESTRVDLHFSSFNSVDSSRLELRLSRLVKNGVSVYFF